MQSKEFIDTLLFKLYEMFPGKWEIIEDVLERRKKIFFNDEYVEHISYEWIEAIDEMKEKDIEFVGNTTFNAIAERLVENGI